MMSPARRAYKYLIQFRAHVITDFADLSAPARALLAASPSFDTTLPWLQALARHTLQAGERVELLCLEHPAEEGRPQVVLPLVRAEAGAGGVRGRSLRALANYYTGLYAPLAADGVNAATLGELLAQALARDVAHWEALDLNPMDPESPVFAALRRGLRARGCYVQPYFRFGNWYLDLGGRSYAAYRDSLPSRLQNTLKRKGRKLAASPAARFEIVQTRAGLDTALDGYERIYAKSWQQSEAYPQFVREIAHAFAERDWLRLGMLWLNGQPAAAQLWFVHGATAYIFKLAYDPQYAELSAGSLLTAHLMEHVIDVDGVQMVDYLSGDDSYKRDWMSGRRERWGLRVYRLNSLGGWAGAARSVAGQLARRGLRAVRGASAGSAS